MIRYLAQSANSSICGPVAIINILKFFNFHVTKKSLAFVKYKCNYDNGNGTDDSDLSKAIRSFNSLKFFIKKSPKIELINKHLNKGSVILMLTVVQDEKEIFGHYWTISNFDGEKYTCHNYHAISTEYMTEKELLDTLKQKHQDMPKAWFISER